MPRNPNRTSEGQTPNRKKVATENFGTRIGRREIRAADSAATGHVQTVGDSNFYDWMASWPGKPAPHHVNSLAYWRSLTKGRTPEQIAELRQILRMAGLDLGDHEGNLRAVDNNPNNNPHPSRGRSTHGDHAEIHAGEDKLLKQMGFKVRGKGGATFYGTPVDQIDWDTYKNLLLSFALNNEAIVDDVERRAGQRFRQQPDYQQQLDTIREQTTPKPGPNLERTIGSARTTTNPEFLAAQDPNVAATMQEANRRQLTTPYTGRQQVPANDALVNPVTEAATITTPKPKPTVSPAPEPMDVVPEVTNPFRNRLMGTRRGWSQPYSNRTPTPRRTRGSLKVRETAGGPQSLGAFDGLGYDPTEYIPRGRTTVTGDGPDAISPGGEVLPTLPIAIP